MRHGSQLDPPNRFESHHREVDLEQIEGDDDFLHQLNNRRIEYLTDDSQSIVAHNDSPDIPFNYSINPYRGCAHGCAYCYARNTHEYLGMNAGLDFETKIVVKHNAAELFREFLARPSWSLETIVFSGVTDCYQPAERQLQLTRQCLQVALKCRQPVGIVTKNALVLRDLDVLAEMASHNLVHVFLSINSLRSELARDMEPRTSTPAARLRAVSELAQDDIPVGVMVAPVIAGLNDQEIAAVLAEAKQAGAQSASFTLLRLPLTVEPVFREWLVRTHPEQHQKILTRQREMHNGKLNNSQWGTRMRGSGELADQIKNMFNIFAAKYGLDRKLPLQDCSQFRPPILESGQLRLF